MVFPVAVESKVTVPELWVKVPLFVKLPKMVRAFEACAVKVVLAEIVMLPFKSNVVELVAAVTTTEVLVPFPTVKFPTTVVVPAWKV